MMGLFSTRVSSNLPLPPEAYDVGYFRRLAHNLEQIFNAQNAVQHVSVASMNINTDTLPTEADLSTLRVGDVYRDTTAGNALKVKV